MVSPCIGFFKQFFNEFEIKKKIWKPYFNAIKWNLLMQNFLKQIFSCKV